MLISGKYVVESQLGQGAMGVVYKVEHIALGTTSALKVLQTHLLGKSEVVKRFYREARVMARLSHPNIARVVDVHHDDALQFHYFVMEYVEGKTLRQYLQAQGPLPLATVLDITGQVARALHYAHSYNPCVIHRDIKPTNIIIENGSQRVVVTDFGIAKEMAEEVDQTEITRDGTLLGTLKYCPPEQIRNESLDGSADIYALGMVMYEAYTGAHLFDGLKEHEIVAKVLHPEEYELSFQEATPAQFAMLVRRAIAKTPAQRYRRMADLLGDLGACRADLDETTLVISPVGATLGVSPKRLNTDVTLLEKHFNESTEERVWRLAVQLQAKARESREKAIREGAAQLAPNPFKEGCAREQAGLDHLHQDQYSLAQEAYQQAVELFGQACERAIAEALTLRAEQARQEMLSAKTQADRYQAEDRARTVYERALTLQGQGEDRWKHQSYREVWQIYSEARSLFEEAQQLAYRGLREEAKAAQIEVKTARERAIERAAEELAAQVFWEAVRYEEAADMALAEKEFIQAGELYRVANRQFELAEQHASAGHEPRQAMRHPVKEATQTTETRGGRSEEPEHRPVQEARDGGDARIEKQASPNGAEAYRRESGGYEHQRDFERNIGLLRQIELTALVDRQREQAKRAKARVQALQERASRMKGGRRSQGQIQWAVSQADRLFQQESYPEALARFEETATLLSSQLNGGVLRLGTRRVTRYPGLVLAPLVLVAVVYWTLFSNHPSGRDLAPPSISTSTPDQEGEVVLESGRMQAFAVQAKGSPKASPLRYTWFLNDEKQAEGPQWVYRPEMWETGKQRVRVVVSDRHHRTVEKHWQIQIASASDRLRIDRSTPTADALEVRASSARQLITSYVSPEVKSDQEFIIDVGQRQIFTFMADSSEQRTLSYSWFLDGKKRGEGIQFVYRPRPIEARLGVRELKAMVSDDQGQSLEKLWRVRIRAVGRGPEIIAASPQNTQPITLTTGAPQGFSIEASDPDDGDQLTYVWSLNGHEMGRGKSWSWKPGELYQGGVHTVGVTVLDKAGLTTQRLWSVTVPVFPVPSQTERSVKGTVRQEPAATPRPIVMPSDRLIRIERAFSTLASARPGDTVEFVTEYLLTLPAGIRDKFVRVTWALERKGKKLGEEGIHTRMAKAGAHAASNQFTLPKYMRPGRYAVEHKVQVGDSYDIARSYFSVVPN